MKKKIKQKIKKNRMRIYQMKSMQKGFRNKVRQTVVKRGHEIFLNIRYLGKNDINTFITLVRRGELWTLIKKLAGRFTKPMLTGAVRQQPQAESAKPVFSVQSSNSKKPVVSIIIPVHNGWEYTYPCIETLISYTGEVPYEIILADDCSTDVTPHGISHYPAIRVVRSGTSVGYVKICNNAARQARGAYLVFLSNQVTFMSDWLSPLLQIMEREPSVGIVGPKMIYPDGMLQEAGGILWSDASRENYGNLEEPSLPEYNYIKEVDYVSGACLMVRRTLWEAIGGFDERYSPEYYGDADCAFRARKAGYLVLYQPQSLVIHHAMVSEGMKLSAGMQADQQANRRTFRELWKDELESNHFEKSRLHLAANTFRARERSKHRRVMLVIDHAMPEFDTNAGARSQYQYMRLFQKMGYVVKFLPNVPVRLEPYCTELEQLGMEMLVGHDFITLEKRKKWIRRNAANIDCVYLNRPDVAAIFIDEFKRFKHIKVFYMPVDLHHLRLTRQYELEKRKELLQDAEKYRKIDDQLFRKADVVHVFGSYECRYVREGYPDKIVRNVPLYIYDTFSPPVTVQDIKKRSDLMFVGGFAHPPNGDAMQWFIKNIFPAILEKIPGIRLHIVGSKTPDSITAMASESILIRGFLSDEELRHLYADCRIAILPLRFGAGIKGKLIEAMYSQIAVVSTSIGVEGLDNLDGAVAVADTAEEFARKVVELYGSPEQMHRNIANARQYLVDHFSEKSVLSVLELDL